MLNKYRHFYLYAKNHYKRTDLIEDLKKIAGNYTGCDPTFERIGDIMAILTDAMTDLYGTDTDSFKHFSHRLLDKMTRLVGFEYVEEPAHIAYINTCLYIMGNMKVDDIDGSLGNPDYSILPEGGW